MREREPITFPTWRRSLEDYQRAFADYHANPASLATTAFLDRAIVRLDEAYREPGLFPLGLIALTSGACDALSTGKHLAEEFLIRHKNGDFGLMEPDDVGNNRYAIPREYQVTSRYQTRKGAELWIATHGNRSATHLFTREEH